MSNWRLIKGWETPDYIFHPQKITTFPASLGYCVYGTPKRTDDNFSYPMPVTNFKNNPEWFAQDLPDGWMRPEDGVAKDWYWICDFNDYVYFGYYGVGGWKMYGSSTRIANVKAIKKAEKPEPPKI